MFGDRFSSSTSCSRGVHETEPDRPDQSLTCCFLKVATHPNELFDDIPCDICDVTLGTPIVISGAIPVTDIDFPLDLGGSVSGKVTDAASGDPLASVSVRVTDADGSFRASGFSDADGNYTSRFSGLPTGNYFANTRNAPGYFDELYDDLPCNFGDCDPTTGTQILVNLGVETGDIDFELDKGGAITGTVTSTADGSPLFFTRVEIWDDTGNFITSDSTNSSGQYISGGGLEAGIYYATTLASFGQAFINELYDDNPCPGGAPAGCDPTTGDPIGVFAGILTTNIDFALDLEPTADLTVTALDGPAAAFIGGQIQVSADIANSGMEPAGGPFRLGFYFSTDPNIDTSDVFSGSFCDFVDLAGGGADVCDTMVTVPMSLIAGTHYLGAIVDDLDQIVEATENNNSRAADSGPIDLYSDCALVLDLGYDTGNLTLNFLLGTEDPARWDVWFVSILGFNRLWTFPISAVDPIVSFPVPLTFPSIGNIGIVTTLTGSTGLTCFDFGTVDTGGTGATIEELRETVGSSGILPQSPGH